MIVPTADYPVSRDYRRLWELAHQSSIVCIVDMEHGKPDTCRDIAKTSYSPDWQPELVQVGSRGIGHVWAESVGQFINGCEACNLEWLVPPQPVAEGLTDQELLRCAKIATPCYDLKVWERELRIMRAAIAADRALLAQPVAEGPTDEEIIQEAIKSDLVYRYSAVNHFNPPPRPPMNEPLSQSARTVLRAAGDSEHSLFLEAGRAEMKALELLNHKEKPRTFSVTAVSAASLFYKGRDLRQAEMIAYSCLANESILDFAADQLRDILQVVWNERAQAEAGIQFVPGQVSVTVDGGEIVRGGPPPLKLRRSGEGRPGPTTPKPPIRPHPRG